MEAKFAEGMIKGELNGFKKNSIITAIKLLSENLSIELISRCTRLKIDDVKEIKNNLEIYKEKYLKDKKEISLKE